MKKKNLRQYVDERGKLVYIEQLKDVPFEIKRIYYMYDMKNELRRGCHAHKETEQMLVCISGSCKILLDDGNVKEEVLLGNPGEGLYVEKNVWHEMYDFSEGTILVVLASELYDERDYIRDYEEFQKYVENANLGERY